MTLLDEIKAEGAPRGCRVLVAYSALSVAESLELFDALADSDSHSSASIARVLTKRGLNTTSAAVARHRRKECPCG